MLLNLVSFSIFFLFNHLFLDFSKIQTFRRFFHFVGNLSLEDLLCFEKLFFMLWKKFLLKLFFLAIEIQDFFVPQLSELVNIGLLIFLYLFLFPFMITHHLLKFFLFKVFFELLCFNFKLISLYIVTAFQSLLKVQYLLIQEWLNLIGRLCKISLTIKKFRLEKVSHFSF